MNDQVRVREDKRHRGDREDRRRGEHRDRKRREEEKHYKRGKDVPFTYSGM